MKQMMTYAATILMTQRMTFTKTVRLQILTVLSFVWPTYPFLVWGW